MTGKEDLGTRSGLLWCGLGGYLGRSLVGHDVLFQHLAAVCTESPDQIDILAMGKRH